jgi:hypothetical protein
VISFKVKKRSTFSEISAHILPEVRLDPWQSLPWLGYQFSTVQVAIVSLTPVNSVPAAETLWELSGLTSC